MTATAMNALLNNAHMIAEIDVQIERLMADRGGRMERLIAQMAAVDAANSARAQIEATATAEEFREFQAQYFPFAAVSDQPAPAIQPQTQDDRQVTHGSDEVAAGGDREMAQSEQVIAVAVSEEREQPRKDPETAPEAAPEPVERSAAKEAALGLYAETLLIQREIAGRVGVSLTVFQGWLTAGRRDADKRVAQGDLCRHEAKYPPAPKPAQVEPSAAPAADQAEPLEPAPDPKPGEICAINLDTCVVSHGGKSIQLVRHEMRMLLALNSGAPITLEDMLAAAGVMTGRRVDSEIGKLNPRIRQIGLWIEKLPTGEYELLPTTD